jgi:hypothetical protein
LGGYLRAYAALEAPTIKDYSRGRYAGFRENSMKCPTHPNEDAIAICARCKKLLCDICAVPQRDGSSLCDQCAMLSTLQQMGERVEEKQATKEEKEKLEKDKKKKRAIVRNLIIICVGMVIAGVELFYYFQISKPEAEEFIPSEDPATMTMIIDQAIQDYKRNNGGILPFKLTNLLGTYLPADKIGPNDLADFTYIRSSPTAYELRPKSLKAGTRHIPEFFFTDEGLEIVQ